MIAKFLNITPISLWFIADISTVNGVYKPIYNWGTTLQVPKKKQCRGLDRFDRYGYGHVDTYDLLV